MNENLIPFQLLEAPSPKVLMPGLIEPWMIAAVVACTLVAIADLILQKNKAQARKLIDRREAARAKAATALENMQCKVVQDAAAQASLILRRYLSEATGEPMLFETHVKSISRHEALNDFTEKTRKEVHHGFSVLAALKSAPRDTYVSVIHVIVESQRLLKVFHEGFKA